MQQPTSPQQTQQQQQQPPSRPAYRWALLGAMGLSGVGMATLLAVGAEPAAKKEWRVHDRERPQPPVVTPGEPSTPERVGTAPSDAIVLFDGKDLSAWKADKAPGGEAKWKVENGYFEVVPKAGGISTKESFGDCQFHAEWMAPNPPKGKDQDRGNSGIFLMGRYELQVLDNYQAETYADGMAGSIYGQYPPQVNATRKPGEWQTYDVIFHAPRFGDDGKVVSPARVTSFLNGVLVQDNVELRGGTSHLKLAQYSKHPDKLPISLQDHAHPVRFRNMWIRPITNEHPEAPALPGVKPEQPAAAPAK